MTDYRRGSGPEPWDPNDPLYGEQGWGRTGDGSWDGYPQEQAGYPGQGYPDGGVPDPYGAAPGPHSAHGQDGQQGGWHQGGQGYDQGGHGYHQGQGGGQDFDYGNQGYDTGAHQQYGNQQYGQGGPGHGYDPYQGQGQGGPGYGGQSYGDQPYGQGGDHHGPGYAAGPPHPQGQGGEQGHHHPQDGGYGADGPHGRGHGYDDGYGDGPPAGDTRSGNAHAPPAGRDRSDRGEPGADGPGPDPETGWDPGPDQGETDFFTREDGDWDDDAETEEKDGRGRRGDKPPKRRGGVACLGVAVLLLGTVGAAGYFGKQFYDSRFGPPPDYAGEGTGEVFVSVVDGDTLTAIGVKLRDEGVVASVGAFTRAAEGTNIQPGYYALRREMSAQSAVEVMTDPDTLNTLIIPEGTRSPAIYETIDAKLELEDGTTAEVAASGTVELPDWAVPGNDDVKEPLEGFLWPARYDIGPETQPEELLQAMVDRAVATYEEMGLADAASGLGLDSAVEIVNIASLVQAEGKTTDDFTAMAEVIYNRLKPDNTETYGLLQFDSSFNYLRGQSEAFITENEILNEQDPYNTYVHKGLPPGPIGNPGREAVEAALNPTDEGWMYFITLDDVTTEFTRNHEDHNELREEYNRRRGAESTS
ncbi:endolytic transglycosylase MltG [Streptomyces bohaiensis]|uniref:endolytic transglycosylase MltG n=1 Tax=Streptomyces bohaiensis TaxID=1431344 RepID=UPI003B80D700